MVKGAIYGCEEGGVYALDELAARDHVGTGRAKASVMDIISEALRFEISERGVVQTW